MPLTEEEKAKLLGLIEELTEKPAEAPAEGAPAEAAPAEAPAEEKPAEEKPAEGAPAEQPAA